MKLVNLTQHVINIVGPSGEKIVDIAPEGVEARIAIRQIPAGEVSPEGTTALVPLVTISKGAVEGLPPPQDGVIYIVSGMVREASPERRDVASPGDQVRDKDKRPCGCKGLILNS